MTNTRILLTRLVSKPVPGPLPIRIYYIDCHLRLHTSPTMNTSTHERTTKPSTSTNNDHDLVPKLIWHMFLPKDVTAVEDNTLSFRRDGQIQLIESVSVIENYTDPHRNSREGVVVYLFLL